MKSSHNAPRSIRYSIFIGVLTGTLFSGSGAYAAEFALLDLRTAVLNGDVQLEAGDTYIAGDAMDPQFLGGGSSYFGDFSGSFSGNGGTITGLTVPLFNIMSGSVSQLNLITEETGVTGQGVLANVVDVEINDTIITGGTVSDVSASGSLNSNSAYTGGLVGALNASTSITNSNSSVNVNSTALFDVYNCSACYLQGAVGGLVGKSNEAIITNSHATGEVTGSGNEVGGLVGQLTGGLVSNSSAAGDVAGQKGYVGGLIGVVSGGQIENSHATGDVIGGAEGKVGGLVGGLTGEITDGSYASGAVTGISTAADIGGLVGYGDLQANINNSYSTGSVTGDINVGGLVGRINGGLISNSYSTAAVNSGVRTLDIDGNCATYCQIDNFGGLVGRSSTATWMGAARGLRAGEDGSTWVTTATLIDYSYATGEVTVSGDQGDGGTGVGGLVGYSEGAIMNSYASGDVNAGTRAGGLVGELGAYSINPNLFFVNPDASDIENPYLNFINENGLIKNSYATGKINEGNSSANRLGGLVGVSSGGKILNSHTTAGGIGIEGGCDSIGGLIGESTSGSVVEDSYAHITGNLIGGCGGVGGLAGSFSGSGSRITNSYAYVDGSICGYLDDSGCYASGSYFGGLIGYAPNLVTITNSYAFITGEVYGGSYFGSQIGFYDFDGDEIGVNVNQSETPDPFPSIPSVFTVVTTNTSPSPFAVDQCLNSGKPYLIDLENSYEASDSPGCSGDDATDGGTQPRRDRSEREFREVLETRTPEKIEKLDGFKKEAQLVKDAAVTFVEPTEKIELTKVKAVEITATANVRVNAKADEALQISLKSESKEPVELWVKSPDGKWLLAGVITFDKDGKAILPPLQFKSAGDFTLVFNKQSADSAKGSAPLNQTGSLLVAVS